MFGNKSAALHGAQRRRSTRGRPGAQAGAALSPVRALPAPDGAPIDTETVSHHMNGEVTLKQFDRTKSSPLEFSRAPLWAHGVPPAADHNLLAHYFHRDPNRAGITEAEMSLKRRKAARGRLEELAAMTPMVSPSTGREYSLPMVCPV